mgnify:CR=1 FL=1
MAVQKPPDAGRAGKTRCAAYKNVRKQAFRGTTRQMGVYQRSIGCREALFRFTGYELFAAAMARIKAEVNTVPVNDGSRGQQQFQKWYQEQYNQIKPKPPLLKNILWAFAVGGLICTLGQVIQNYFAAFGLAKKEAGAATSAVLIFLAALFTGLGVYDELGRRAGAGSIVPITGFANSIVAPALEFKREGYVFGIGARMFVIAGPVIVYGLVTACAVGFIYWLGQ